MRKTQKEIIAMFTATAEKFIKKVDDSGYCLQPGWLYLELKECLKAATPTITAKDLASTERPLTPLQKLILKYFMVKGPMTDNELEITINQFSPSGKKYPPSSLRSRRAELVSMGKLRNGRSPVSRIGARTVKAWEATPVVLLEHPSVLANNLLQYRPNTPTYKFIPES